MGTILIQTITESEEKSAFQKPNNVSFEEELEK